MKDTYSRTHCREVMRRLMPVFVVFLDVLADFSVLMGHTSSLLGGCILKRRADDELSSSSSSNLSAPTIVNFRDFGEGQNISE
jgi:hypothetical protein